MTVAHMGLHLCWLPEIYTGSHVVLEVIVAAAQGEKIAA